MYHTRTLTQNRRKRVQAKWPTTQGRTTRVSEYGPGHHQESCGRSTACPHEAIAGYQDQGRPRDQVRGIVGHKFVNKQGISRHQRASAVTINKAQTNSRATMPNKNTIKYINMLTYLVKLIHTQIIVNTNTLTHACHRSKIKIVHVAWSQDIATHATHGRQLQLPGDQERCHGRHHHRNHWCDQQLTSQV